MKREVFFQDVLTLLGVVLFTILPLACVLIMCLATDIRFHWIAKVEAWMTSRHTIESDAAIEEPGDGLVPKQPPYVIESCGKPLSQGGTLGCWHLIYFTKLKSKAYLSTEWKEEHLYYRFDIDDSPAMEALHKRGNLGGGIWTGATPNVRLVLEDTSRFPVIQVPLKMAFLAIKAPSLRSWWEGDLRHFGYDGSVECSLKQYKQLANWYLILDGIRYDSSQ